MRASIAVVVSIACVIACVRVAGAQPGAMPPPPVYYAPPPPQAPPGEELSESTALWLSLGGTIASYGLVAAGGATSRSGGSDALATIGSIGIFVAPSFGHWYADKYWTRGMSLRVGAIGVMVGGLLIALMASTCPLYGDHSDADCNDATADSIAIGAVVAGGLMFLGGTVDDIIQAPARVRRHNAALRGGTFTLAPLRTHDAAGLALVGRW